MDSLILFHSAPLALCCIMGPVLYDSSGGERSCFPPFSLLEIVCALVAVCSQASFYSFLQQIVIDQCARCFLSEFMSQNMFLKLDLFSFWSKAVVFLVFKSSGA